MNERVKKLRYNRKYLTGFINVGGGRWERDPNPFALEDLQKENPNAKYVLIGLNDLALSDQDSVVILHHGPVSDIVLLENRKAEIPVPQYVNTEDGARSYYSVWLLPSDATPADFAKRFMEGLLDIASRSTYWLAQAGTKLGTITD